jgi:hypothetical protein
METDEIEKRFKDPQPWRPITNPVDLKHLGKLSEELNECGAAVSRCIIQGMNECEPVTGKENFKWLEDEIADVIANIELVEERFGLYRQVNRINKKKHHLKAWHEKA